MTNQQQENVVAALLPSLPYKPYDWSQRRRRLRGQKRYYRNILHKAKNFQPDLSVGSWYDFWHYHADWRGYGNLGWKHRRTHIQALCTVFTTIARNTEDYYQPYQLWLYLDREDCGQDAVYFHTPNPNGEGDHFPHNFKNIAWGLPALENYIGGLLGLPVRAGVERHKKSRYKSQTMYLVYSPAHGESLE